MSWYKNKTTGLVWEILDKSVQNRLDNDSDYEVTVEPTPEKSKEPKK